MAEFGGKGGDAGGGQGDSGTPGWDQPGTRELSP